MEHVKFVSYNGEYPNLCSGILTLEIDGKTHTFGKHHTLDRCHDCTKDYSECDNCTKDGCPEFYPFWNPTGDFDDGVWDVEISDLPDEIMRYAKEIEMVFRENVYCRCCGGCI